MSANIDQTWSEDGGGGEVGWVDQSWWRTLSWSAAREQATSVTSERSETTPIFATGNVLEIQFVTLSSNK